MAVLNSYNINAMATQISKEFFINENPEENKSYILVDEMRLFAMDMKSRVTFISRAKVQTYRFKLKTILLKTYLT